MVFWSFIVSLRCDLGIIIPVFFIVFYYLLFTDGNYINDNQQDIVDLKYIYLRKKLIVSKYKVLNQINIYMKLLFNFFAEVIY